MSEANGVTIPIKPERRRMEIRGTLAIVYTIGYFAVIVLTYYVKPPIENADVIKTLIGLLSAIQIGIAGYYFGSSRDIAVAQNTKQQENHNG